MSAPTNRDLSQERREVLLAEYQAAQASAQHHDQLLWTVTSIVWATNLVLLGVIPALQESVWAFLIRTGFCVVGPLLIIFAWSSQSQFRKLKVLAYQRCKVIEEEMGMRHHTAVRHESRSQTVIYGLISAAFLIIWVFVAMATWARGEGSVANKRINAPHSAVTALANGSKRRAVGRARYAQRSTD